MGTFKLLFAGSHGAGKTTAIATISEISALDYGELTLENGKKLRFYTTSGPSPNDYITKGSFKGLIILINNAGPDPIGDLARCIDMFREFINKVNIVVGITHLDIADEPPLQSYHDYLNEYHIQLPVFPVDARSQSSLMTLIKRFQ